MCSNINQEDSRRPAFRDWADSIAKLAAAAAIVWGAYIANSYQAKSTAVQLLSERERAETALRASMFSDLIKPLVGEDMGATKVGREQLLVELLALNFHEHFEFKPLLLHVDERLKTDKDGLKKIRQLREIMRRVVSRQVNMMLSIPDVPTTAKGMVTRFVVDAKGKSCENLENKPSLLRDCGYGKKIVLFSPDRRYKLETFVVEPEWDDETVRVSATLIAGESAADVDLKVDFRLTWYDLPFTDHTLLADGTRFAFFIDEISRVGDKEWIRLGVVWFPKDFFSPRERPISFTDFRKHLGLEMKEAGKE